MTQLSSEKKANARWRDVMLYLLIAVTLVGAEVIGLIRDWPRPSLRAAVGLFSTVILAVYLIKVFKTKLRSVEFWLLLTMLLLIHVLWILLVPFLIVMVGLGIELFAFGMFLQHFVRVR
ncbi:MAG TPA: hypothetical protein VGK24_00305 [Candidatus Angelobacter sp.]